MSKILPVWRSQLFVPVTVPKFVEGALKRGADAIILDLEDSIAPAQKELARALVPETAKKISGHGMDILVRVNCPWRLLVRDLEAVIGADIYGLVMPKVESAEHLDSIDEVIGELENERGLAVGTTKIHALVETASAFLRMGEIARHPRLVAMSVGGEDFSQSVGMVPEIETLFYPKQQGVIAARAASILPMGFLGSIAEFKDVEAFRQMVRKSRRIGLMGASCIHPTQVTIVNEEFTPTDAEVDFARRLVAAYDEAMANKLGAVTFEGKMIDVPIVRRAQDVLRRAEALQARLKATGK